MRIQGLIKKREKSEDKLKLIATQGHYNDSNFKKKNIADIFKFNNLCKIGVFSFLNDM